MTATVSPRTNLTVPVTHRENISYDCMVAPGARPEWAINNAFQFIHPDDTNTSQTVSSGIFIEIISPVVTRLVITPEARDARLGGESMNTIECKCRGIFEPDQEEATTVAVSVTTYSELHSSYLSALHTYVRELNYTCSSPCVVTVFAMYNCKSHFIFQIARRLQAT